MAETLYKDTTYTVSLLVQSIGLGKVALPDIQRPFVWQASKVRALFDSMYKGLRLSAQPCRYGESRPGSVTRPSVGIHEEDAEPR